MRIYYQISTSTLGDTNTRQDNFAYIKSVATALALRFPHADIDVQLNESSTGDCIEILDYDFPSIITRQVKEIAANIWDNEMY